jgi:hypothetical protein
MMWVLGCCDQPSTLTTSPEDPSEMTDLFISDSEEWRTIADWPDYEVSSMGRVKRKTDHRSKFGIVHPAGYFLKPYIDPDGRPAVTLSRNKKRKTIRISVLVCTAFHGQKPTLFHVAAHINGQPSDDRATNLYWATVLQNTSDVQRHGAIRKRVDDFPTLVNAVELFCRIYTSAKEPIEPWSVTYERIQELNSFVSKLRKS